jgi:hypothetical protein
MYCPSCGSEERLATQFCRACGIDLRPVRVGLERPDGITSSAITAREEIGRAVAEKIREMEGSRDLKRVAEDVLPQIEKFLESPDEKRLRRMRSGVITAASGLGASVVSLLLTTAPVGTDTIPLLVLMVGLGLVAFLIGLGLILNGLLFTKPRKGLKDNSADARTQNLLDTGHAPPKLRPSVETPELFRAQTTSDLAHTEPPAGSSVTEHTTHLLKTER